MSGVIPVPMTHLKSMLLEKANHRLQVRVVLERLCDYFIRITLFIFMFG